MKISKIFSELSFLSDFFKINIYITVKMSKKFSGAEYRKQKSDRDKENQKQAGSFLKYLKQEQESL